MNIREVRTFLLISAGAGGLMVAIDEGARPLEVLKTEALGLTEKDKLHKVP